MQEGKRFFRLRNWVRRHQKSLLIGFGSVAIVTAGVFLTQYFLPAKITFSYANETSCTNRLTLLPDTLKQSNEDSFTIAHSGGVSHLLSTEVCATATEQPTSSEYTETISPFGWNILGSSITITPENPPTIASATSTELPISKPLEIQLSSPDVLHTYSLRIADQSTACTGSERLACSLENLELAQGKTYEFSLERQFGSDEPREIDSGAVSILSAVTAKKSSITNGAVIYDKPKQITVQTDKDLISAAATLSYTQDKKTVPIDTTVKIDGSTIVVSTEKDLPRQAELTLTISAAEATNGSRLAKPYTLKFTTSGAPKVTGSTLGYSGTQSGAYVTVYFDQPITAASAKGKVSVNGSILSATASGSTLQFTLPNIDRCASFTVTVAKGVVGSKNNLTNNESWSMTSRIACGTSRVIGYSVQKRPIIAYYFGTPGGSTTLFTGGIHGEEYSGTQTMDAWISYLTTNGYRIPSGKQIVIIPRLNPDGLAAGTRFNARGVNLDRNYPTSDWIADIDSSNGVVKGGGGTSAGSEPETKAAMHAITGLNVRLAIAYHAQGSLVGSNNTGSADGYASRYASYVGYGNMSYNPEATLGYSITAELETWLAERGTPAILIELPTRSGNYLSWHQDIMWSIATE